MVPYYGTQGVYGASSVAENAIYLVFFSAWNGSLEATSIFIQRSNLEKQDIVG